jgi:hypothetical protein
MTAPPVRSGSTSMQAFRGIRAATRGLIAGPWTPLAFLCSRGIGAPAAGRASRRRALLYLFSKEYDACTTRWPRP